MCSAGLESRTLQLYCALLQQYQRVCVAEERDLRAEQGIESKDSTSERISTRCRKERRRRARIGSQWSGGLGGGESPSVSRASSDYVLAGMQSVQCGHVVIDDCGGDVCCVVVEMIPCAKHLERHAIRDA